MGETTSDKLHDIHPFSSPIWEIGIVEVRAHSLESAGREEVNELLQQGWLLLHIYTLKYFDEDGGGTWRERPMAVLGKPGTNT